MALLRGPVQTVLQEFPFQPERVKRWQKEPESAVPEPDEL